MEPFVGSGALFFALKPNRAVIADINEELIGMYRAVRVAPERVLEAFRRFPTGPDAYYRIRALNLADAAPAERAARFLYLNRYCFNGLYRTNGSGDFNVPYGPPKTHPLRFEERVIEGSRVLSKATLMNVDFESVIAQAAPGDFVYLDPPYAVDDRRIFAEYLPGSFSRLDLPRLQAALEHIDAVGATFFLSYATSAEARMLCTRWHHKTVRVRRNVAGFSGHRRNAYEILASNIPFPEHRG